METEPLEKPARVSRFRAALAIVTLRSAFWERSNKHRVCRFLARVAYLYAVILIVLLWLENWFLFPASKASETWGPPPTGCVFEEVWLTSADGTRIHAWWAKPVGWESSQGAILYCHGNGGNISHRRDYLEIWVKERRKAVLIFDYPGYGKSEGKPTESGCYAAANAAYAWLTEEKKVAPERIILYGGSLGGAIAVDLACRLPHRALFLVATFTSFPDMAQNQFPYFPARWLVRNRLDSLSKISSVKTPVFVTHATGDQLIPFSMGKRLFEAANEPKQFFTRQNHYHDEGCSPEAYAAFEEFLKKHAP